MFYTVTNNKYQLLGMKCEKCLHQFGKIWSYNDKFVTLQKDEYI